MNLENSKIPRLTDPAKAKILAMIPRRKRKNILGRLYGRTMGGAQVSYSPARLDVHFTAVAFAESNVANIIKLDNSDYSKKCLNVIISTYGRKRQRNTG